ncbi:hypothetical protein C7B62_05030 [Pleurocapsa sp. CCALA 161]|nr:hypothetical protein C7B62_05030 [Pleurocapsa sp. CCALA 161]
MHRSLDNYLIIITDKLQRFNQIGSDFSKENKKKVSLNRDFLARSISGNNQKPYMNQILRIKRS